MKQKALFKLVAIAIFVICFGSCNGQIQNNDICNVHYKNARNSLNSYYQNENKDLLNHALEEVELFSKCAGSTPASVELKISILSLLEKYKEGLEYLNSLKESDFKYPYKKEMGRNYFLALLNSSEPETIKKNRFLNKAALSVQKYIDSSNFSSVKDNQEVFYDLFYMKSLILTQQDLIKEINDLKRIYPNDIEFLDILIETFSEENKSTTPFH